MNRILLFSALLLIAQMGTNAQKQLDPTLSTKNINAQQLLADIEILSADDMEGRGNNTAGAAKARVYIVQRFSESGLKPIGETYFHNFVWNYRKSNGSANGVNVVGYIKGSKHPEKYIVVSAHYDHLGVLKGDIYNGADDNASGTAALFAIAKYFSKNRPDNSIIFVAFDAEEQWLSGSEKFVAGPPVEKDSIVMNINLDMISHNDINELYVIGTFHYPFLKPYMESVAKKATVKILFGHEGPNVDADDDWTTQSDNYSFHQANIPYLSFGVEDHPDYHKSTDDFNKINRSFYVRAVETILLSVKTMDKNLTQIEKQKADAK